MAIAVVIGTTRTVAYEPGPSYDLQVSQRGAANVQIHIAPGEDPAIVPGMKASIYIDADRVFVGSVDTVGNKWQNNLGQYIMGLGLVSSEQKLDKRFISQRRYVNKYAGDIIADILDNVVPEEGIGPGTISNGAVIASVVYDNTAVADAFSQLATTCGFDWSVEPINETLNFGPRTAATAPFTLTNSKCLAYPEISVDRQDIRNRQKIRLDFSAFPSETNFFSGAATYATASGTLTDLPNDGDTVSIGSRTYTFRGKVTSTVFTGVGLNDLTAGGKYTDGAADPQTTFTVQIVAATTPNTFKWRRSAGSFSDPIQITGAIQLLSDGITVTFGSTTGHTVGNSWLITASAGSYPFDVPFGPTPMDTIINLQGVVQADTLCLALILNVQGGTFFLKAKLAGTATNGTTLATTATPFTWSAATMTGGTDGEATETLKPIAFVESISQTRATFATAAGLLDTQPNDGDTVTLGPVTYTFKTALDNSQPFQVLIGATAPITAVNLQAAVDNLADVTSASIDTRYSLPTWSNPSVMIFFAGDNADGSFSIQARFPGSSFNGTPISTTCAGLVFTGNTLTGGDDGGDPTQQAIQMSFGVEGVDQGRDWTYVPGSKTLTPNVPLAAGISIFVTYKPIGGDVLAVQDDAAIAARALLEDSSGIYESMIDASQSTDTISKDVNAALARIQGVLASYGEVGSRMTFETYDNGLAPSQLLTVALNAPFDTQLNGTWLIEQVQAQWDGAFDFHYTVTCVSTKRIGTTLQFWQQLALTGSSGGRGSNPLASAMQTAQELLGTFIFDAANTGLVLNSTTNLDIQHPGANVYQWLAVLETPSTSGPAVFDIILQDLTSIMDSGKISIPQNQGTIVSGTNFSTVPYPVDDLSTLQGKITTTGTGAKRAQVKLYGTRQTIAPFTGQNSMVFNNAANSMNVATL